MRIFKFVLWHEFSVGAQSIGSRRVFRRMSKKVDWLPVCGPGKANNFMERVLRVGMASFGGIGLQIRSGERI